MRTADTTCPPDCRCDQHLIAWTSALAADNEHNRLAPWDLVRRRHTWPAWTSKRNH